MNTPLSDIHGILAGLKLFIEGLPGMSAAPGSSPPSQLPAPLAITAGRIGANLTMPTEAEMREAFDRRIAELTQTHTAELEAMQRKHDSAVLVRGNDNILKELARAQAEKDLLNGLAAQENLSRTRHEAAQAQAVLVAQQAASTATNALIASTRMPAHSHMPHPAHDAAGVPSNPHGSHCGCQCSGNGGRPAAKAAGGGDGTNGKGSKAGGAAAEEDGTVGAAKAKRKKCKFGAECYRTNCKRDHSSSRAHVPVKCRHGDDCRRRKAGKCPDLHEAVASQLPQCKWGAACYKLRKGTCDKSHIGVDAHNGKRYAAPAPAGECPYGAACRDAKRGKCSKMHPSKAGGKRACRFGADCNDAKRGKCNWTHAPGEGTSSTPPPASGGRGRGHKILSDAEFESNVSNRSARISAVVKKLSETASKPYYQFQGQDMERLQSQLTALEAAETAVHFSRFGKMPEPKPSRWTAAASRWTEGTAGDAAAAGAGTAAAAEAAAALAAAAVRLTHPVAAAATVAAAAAAAALAAAAGGGADKLLPIWALTGDGEPLRQAIKNSELRSASHVGLNCLIGATMASLQNGTAAPFAFIDKVVKTTLATVGKLLPLARAHPEEFMKATNNTGNVDDVEEEAALTAARSMHMKGTLVLRLVLEGLKRPTIISTYAMSWSGAKPYKAQPFLVSTIGNTAYYDYIEKMKAAKAVLDLSAFDHGSIALFASHYGSFNETRYAGKPAEGGGDATSNFSTQRIAQAAGVMRARVDHLRVASDDAMLDLAAEEEKAFQEAITASKKLQDDMAAASAAENNKMTSRFASEALRSAEAALKRLQDEEKALLERLAAATTARGTAEDHDAADAGIASIMSAQKAATLATAAAALAVEIAMSDAKSAEEAAAAVGAKSSSADEEAAAMDAEAGEETPAINAAATSAGDAAPTVGATDAVVAAVQDEQGANTTASAGGNVDGAPAAAAAAANAAGATLDAQATAAAAATAAATKPNTRSNAAAAQVGRA